MFQTTRSLVSWIKKAVNRGKSPIRKVKLSFRPGVEGLEERIVPIAVTNTVMPDRGP